MTLLSLEKVDLSPHSFGKHDDPIHIEVALAHNADEVRAALEDLQSHTHLPGSPRHDANIASSLIIWPHANELKDAKYVQQQLQEQGIWTIALTEEHLCETQSCSVDEWIKALFQTVRAMVLALKSGDQMQIVWPADMPLEPLERTIQRALKWRGSLSPAEDGDAVTGPAFYA